MDKKKALKILIALLECITAFAKTMEESDDSEAE